MATTISRKTRSFTDLNLLFSKNPITGDVAKRLDEEAIKGAVKNLIQTRNYERPFHPEIGTQIFGLLFENFNPITVEVMKRTIFDVINKFEPRATVLDVKIRDLSDSNALDIEIIFRINDSEQPVTLKTVIDRVR